MELVEQTPTTLYFQKHPFRVQILCALFMVAGIAVIFCFGWKVELTCTKPKIIPWKEKMRDKIHNKNREHSKKNVEYNETESKLPKVKSRERNNRKPHTEEKGKCILKRRNMWMRNGQVIALDNIRAVGIDSSGSAYRVVLLVQEQQDDTEMTETQEILLTHYYSFGYYDKKALVSDLDALIMPNATPWQTGITLVQSVDNSLVLTYVEDNRWFAYGFGALFISVFFIALLLSKKEVCILDKSDDLMVIIRRSVFSHSENSYTLSSITLVEVHRITQHRKTEYKVYFEVDPRDLEDGGGGDVKKWDKWVPMCEQISYTKEEQAVEVCECIRSFLGIPSLHQIMQAKKHT